MSRFYLPAANIITLAYQNQFEIFTSAIVFVNVHYFLDKFDKANKFNLLTAFRSIISIIEVGDVIIDLALKSPINDFEDACQIYIAQSAGVDLIITRNIKDYKHSVIRVLTPEQFLKTL